MRIFRRVALQSMKRNRTRTIVTIIGVILSAAMFTAVTTFASTLIDSVKRQTAYECGKYYVNLNAVDADTLAQMRADSDTQALTAAEVLGYAEVESINEYKPYVYVHGIDASYTNLLPVHLTAGRLPANDSELLLPEHLSLNGGVNWGIGDQVTLKLGTRVCQGAELWQHTSYGAANMPVQFIPRETRSYTVVGIYERPDHEDYSAPGYLALTLSDGQGGTGLYDVYVQTKDCDDSALYAYIDRYPAAGGAATNWEYLRTLGSFRYENYGNSVTSFVLIFVTMIVIGSVSMIYSAFSISVSERTRQFGLLSSVGATRKQLRSTVLHEAAAVSLIGIPLGIAAGCGGMWVTFTLLEKPLNDMFDFGAGIDGIRFHASVPAVGVAALIALATVFISAVIPARRAMRVTAIEAIRQNRDVTTRGRSTRSHKLTYRIFGLPGLLSQKYFRRSRKKYRATILSLSMSVMLFVSAGTYGMYLTKSADVSVFQPNFDFEYMDSHLTFADYEALLPELRGSDGIQSASGAGFQNCMLRLSKDVLAKELPSTLTSVDCHISYLDQGTFDALLSDCGLTRADYEAHPGALIYNHYTTVSYVEKESGSWERHTYDGALVQPGLESLTLISQNVPEGCTFIVTSEEDGEFINYYSRTIIGGDGEEDNFCPAEFEELPILAYTEQDLYGVGQEGSLTVYLPADAAPESMLPGLFCTVSDTEQAKASIAAAFESHDLHYASEQLMDMREANRANRNILLVIKVFSYGFITLISLICVANVFNTISTNVGLRRRDFAMLRSVGMTRGGLNGMVCFECLLYGVRALLLGLLLATGLAYWMFRAAGGVYSADFRLSWSSVIIAAGSVFLVVFVSMMYAMRKVKKENPVDALKEENT